MNDPMAPFRDAHNDASASAYNDAFRSKRASSAAASAGDHDRNLTRAIRRADEFRYLHPERELLHNRVPRGSAETARLLRSPGTTEETGVFLSASLGLRAKPDPKNPKVPSQLEAFNATVSKWEKQLEGTPKLGRQQPVSNPAEWSGALKGHAAKEWVRESSELLAKGDHFGAGLAKMRLGRAYQAEGLTSYAATAFQQAEVHLSRASSDLMKKGLPDARVRGLAANAARVDALKETVSTLTKFKQLPNGQRAPVLVGGRNMEALSRATAQLEKLGVAPKNLENSYKVLSASAKGRSFQGLKEKRFYKSQLERTMGRAPKLNPIQHAQKAHAAVYNGVRDAGQSVLKGAGRALKLA